MRRRNRLGVGRWGCCLPLHGAECQSAALECLPLDSFSSGSVTKRVVRRSRHITHHIKLTMDLTVDSGGLITH